MTGCYLGIDVGSVSTNFVLIDENGNLLKKLYLRTAGRPIEAITNGLKMIQEGLEGDIKILGVGTTGSGRKLAAVIVGADVVKNEITAHAMACIAEYPDARTILEIGGQDSKIIILRDGVVVDFAMNTVCAAGTGSFLDRQAQRLGIPIERFGEIALMSKNPTRIAGRCAVFAESDMIHKQQMGYKIEDILKGLCQALVRNYLANVAKGKEIRPPIVFQGGVAANTGIKKAFEEELGVEIIIPRYFDVMGALGAAILAKKFMAQNKRVKTKFAGFEAAFREHTAGSFECQGCPNLCEVVQIYVDGKLAARWGDRCGRWSASMAV
ncbi:acyl-CoA dehydratase activase [Thermosediminibacter oceani]|uniref:CoA-substrate-specific enzyme activase n=1 Tax=Thermosediminibacter oceani (strain ATCC BAA-1034 / DSM 16646 / JW/IW-1228P) TaxID=555079 RepID=D9S3N7_THEOJ|nr:acyl-CoA dehydratase activase [Thermosediminibacter oceani]ADL08014.1 CoA-substrate-specific enzyme activase [Thermosediminibacter oceani DSM 16646]